MAEIKAIIYNICWLLRFHTKSLWKDFDFTQKAFENTLIFIMNWMFVYVC